MSEEQEATGFWLSPQQERLYGFGVRNAIGTIPLRVPADPARMREILRQVVARHEPFRTVYRRVPGMKLPFQMVLNACDPSWQESPPKWDLENGPLLHAALTPEALVLTAPVLSVDSPSLAILAAEIQTLIEGGELPEPPIRYVQFAQWQRDLLDTELQETDAEAAVAYWAALDHPAVPVLPGENTAPGEYRPDAVHIPIPQVSAPNLLAAWQSLIWRLTGQTEFPIDVFFAARDYDELRNAVGLVGKYIPVNARFSPHSTFAQIQEQAREALETSARYQDYFTAPESLEPIAFEYSESGTANGVANIYNGKLKLSAHPGEADILFDASRYPRETVTRWAEYLKRLLAAAPDGEAGAVPILTDPELSQLAAWNQTAAPWPQDLCFHQLFEAQASETPELIAVRCQDQCLTYRELNGRSNQLAHHIQRFGAAPGQLVGLCVDRSVDMVVAFLAILKAGSAFVAVNADSPKARLAQQLSGTVALITERKLVPLMPELPAARILIDQPTWLDENDSNPAPSATPENLIYVIFTSGSTGVPKAVGIRHRNLVNYAWFIKNKLSGERMNFATVSTLSADLGNTCIYPSLISGGCLHIIPTETAGDSASMAAHNRRYPIDVLKIVPSHLSALLESAEGRDVLPHRHLICGGEALTASLLNRIRELAPACEIWNHYGPTETTVGSLMLNLHEVSGPTIPIGKPIANTQVHIFNDHRLPVPIGVTGELYIAGAGVTAGYLGQPELTAERFIDGIYRTGDLARFLPDGNVLFLGRADDQVKIRGFRIELGEIEFTLLRHPSVRQAVVLAREMQLVAYVVGREPVVDISALRNHLKAQLPDHMVPAAILSLPKLPLNANGKIDRNALPSPEQAASAQRQYAAPATPSEEAVAAVWATVMRRERISVEDDFFELGGHSLLATQIASRLREHFHMPVAVRLIFEQPTVRQLAAELTLRKAVFEQEEEEELGPIVRA